MVVRLMARWLLVALVLAVGTVGAYGIGAGYFSPAGIGVPTPWNYPVTAVVMVFVLVLAARIHSWH